MKVVEVFGNDKLRPVLHIGRASYQRLNTLVPPSSLGEVDSVSRELEEAGNPP